MTQNSEAKGVEWLAGFIDAYGLDEEPLNEPFKIAIRVTYFSFTTLSTVGFGDMFPNSPAEAILCTIIMFAGVALFSYIMTETLVKVLLSLRNLGNDIEYGESLSKWFGIIKRFNMSQPIG